MDPADLDRALSEANPWWRSVDWQERDVQLMRVAKAPFTYEPNSLKDLARGGLYLLRGPRRAGKSTEIKRAIAALIGQGIQARRIVHLSVEGRSSSDLEGMITHIARTLSAQPGECYWFLDEITGVQGSWPEVVKRMRDSNLQFAEDTVVLSGSSATQLEEATKALAGRRGNAINTDRLLFQMPFTAVSRALGYELPAGETLAPDQMSTEKVTELAELYRPWVPDLIVAWDRYLHIGGYPQAVAAHLNRGSIDASFIETLFQVVHGDALARGNLTPVQTAAALRAVSRSLSSTLEVTSLATDTNITPAIAAARLEDLRRSFLAFPVHREQGLAPKPRSQAKWYFTDPLLATLAAARGTGQVPEVSALSEQQVALALLRALEIRSPTAALRHDQLLYYRSSTRAEIDFVAAPFKGVCFESKFVDRGWARAFQTIESSPFKHGIVATHSGLRRHDGGWALPAALLAVILGC